MTKTEIISGAKAIAEKLSANIEIQEYKSYVKNHYPQAARSLRYKEKVEYRLFQHAELVYRWITKCKAFGSIKR